MGLRTVASIEFDGISGSEKAKLDERFESFREAALPGTEWGLTMSNLRSEGDGLVVDVEVEDAFDIDEAQDKLEAFRKAVAPSREFGVTIWNMRPAEDLSPRIGR